MHASATCLLLVGQGACATLMHGTTQDIPILTPGAAAVAVDGIPMGTSPTRVTVSRGSSHLVTITKDSAPAIEIELQRSISGWVWGNIFLDYVPVLVDFLDGAAYKFKTESINVGFPGREASAAMLRADLAVYQRIRFNTVSSGELIEARVDSATTDRLYLHRGSAAGSVAMEDIRRIDVRALDNRWAPHAARRLGSPLLVDDQLFVKAGAGERGLEGRLISMDTVNLLVSTPAALVRVDRSTITSMHRREGHDYAEGAKRSLIVGAILGGLIAAHAHGDMLNPDGPSFMRGNAIGAVLGLSLTPFLSPKKWVEVRKW